MEEGPETRRRSRSNTPFLRSHCDHEHCDGEGHEHHEHAKKTVKKAPNVNTIVEESESTTSNKKTASSNTSKDKNSVEVVNSSQAVQSTGDSRTTVKTVTSSSTSRLTVLSPDESDKSRVAAILAQLPAGARSSSSTTTSRVIRTNVRSGGANETKVKEINENEINNILEKSALKSTLQSPRVLLNDVNKKTSPRVTVKNTTSSHSSKLISQEKNGADSGGGGGMFGMHLAYKMYKEAGEYWNKYPKTDYTYSELSPHRREIVPGVINMPNMSRKSLDKHDVRIHERIQSNPEEESFIRKRYESSNTKYNKKKLDYEDDQNQKLQEHLQQQQKIQYEQQLLREQQENFQREQEKQQQYQQYDNHYDSQDEIDLSEFDTMTSAKTYLNSTAFTTYNNTKAADHQNYNASKYHYNFDYNKEPENTSRLSRFFTSIITTLYLSVNRVTDVFRNSNDNLSKQKMYFTTKSSISQYEKGGFFSNLFLSVFRRFYLMISSILILDTWILQSKTKRNKKGFLICLLILLPFLLLAAYLLSEEHQRAKLFAYLPLAMPFSLVGLKNTIFPYNSWNEFSEKISFASTSNTGNLNFNNKLSENDFNNLINNINLYVSRAVDEKFQEYNNLKSHEIHNNILNQIPIIFNDKITNYHYKLTDEDCDRIIGIVQSKLNLENLKLPSGFSKEMLEEITKIVQKNINLHIHNNNLNVPEINYDEILLHLHSSPKLSGIIEENLHRNLNNMNKDEISGLYIVIDTIKDELLKNNQEIENLKILLNNINIDQSKYQSQLDLYGSDFNTKINNLFAELELLKTKTDGNFAHINLNMKRSLLQIFGYNVKEGDSLDDEAIALWIQNTFATKAYLEEYLNKVKLTMSDDMKKDIESIAGVMIAGINTNLKNEFLETIDRKYASIQGGGKASEIEIRRIVKELLAIYDADKTGLVDYALESAGGQIISTRCTETYHTNSATISIFGIPIWHPANTPRIAISPSVHPGECWAFQGFPGFLVLKLNSEVFVTGFTLEHVSKALTPNGKIDSAPKNFTVLGLHAENDEDPFIFGNYEYAENGTTLQYFPVQNILENKIPYQLVELRIESNHGNPLYTCLYRFRVHGSSAYYSR